MSNRYKPDDKQDVIFCWGEMTYNVLLNDVYIMDLEWSDAKGEEDFFLCRLEDGREKVAVWSELEIESLR